MVYSNCKIGLVGVALAVGLAFSSGFASAADNVALTLAPGDDVAASAARTAKKKFIALA